jgi:hypothetical protein
MEDPFQSSIPELSANPRHQKSFGQGGSGLVSKRLLQQLIAAVSPSLQRAFRDTVGYCFEEGKYVVDIDKDIKIEATKLHTSLYTATKRAHST